MGRRYDGGAGQHDEPQSVARSPGGAISPEGRGLPGTDPPRSQVWSMGVAPRLSKSRLQFLYDGDHPEPLDRGRPGCGAQHRP